LVGDRSVRDTLTRISELTKDAIPAVEMAGITMVVEGRQRTAVFTDGLVPEIDQAQYDTGDGPCLAAYQQQAVFAIPSTSEEGPWPAFREACAAHGIRSTLSMPLGVEGDRLGALNLYAKRERAFDEDTRQTAALFATQASVVLSNARAYWDAHDLSRRLGGAASTRSVIDMAKGIIITARRCSEQEAFDILVAASSRENRKLRDVAARIVHNASNPPSQA
jgi:GAF domain-containing protein